MAVKFKLYDESVAGDIASEARKSLQTIFAEWLNEKAQAVRENTPEGIEFITNFKNT